jgi:prepilin-type N-terminal cleavage/methylation domain-containing protein
MTSNGYRELKKILKIWRDMKTLKKGFTLIELLVVVAIIGILATVVIMNVSSARAKATKSKVASDWAVASKQAAACVSFGGSLTPAATAAAGGVICATAPSDTTEASAAAGNYPATTTNFTPSWTGTTATAYNAVITANTAGGGGTLTCTLTGCVTGGTW